VANLAAAQEQSPINNPVDIATLPRDLTPWGMYMQADIIVKAVMIGLAIASVVTWTVWLAKTIELTAAKRRLRSDLKLMAARRIDALQGLPRHKSIMGRFMNAAAAELELSGGAVEKDGIKERIALTLERIEKAAARRIARGTGVLATIGATAPFVGLFGTVWGIMNSFIGISKSQTTNLAVVAPGIAEALLATALGLAAAIPAVVIYNVFSRQIGGYRDLVGDASAEILRWVSRELDVPRTEAASSRRERSLSAAE
jgi:biopolymer transport protein ExbB